MEEIYIYIGLRRQILVKDRQEIGGGEIDIG